VLSTTGDWTSGFVGRPVLALSPHPDDLAFSVGGLLRWLAARTDVTLVTVFTRNVWAPNLELPQPDEETVSRLRQAEDVRYCERVGVRRLALGLPDAGLRGYDDDTERLAPGPEEEMAAAVREALAAVLPDRCALLCPLGLGGHVDHGIVRDAALAVATGTARQIGFYEDLPYARQLDETEIAAHVRRIDVTARPHRFDLSPPLWRSKLEDLAVYRTQVREQDLDDLSAHARRVSGEGGLAERVWIRARRV
jgi:LmbE family N-acetylglucosaminyl deacetylase